MSCTFKPKGMSYTEFLRSKKSTDVKVINTKKLQDASDITTQRRLGNSRVFALSNQQTKGVISHPIDFSQEPITQTQSAYKAGGGSRRVGSASDFTAYTGGQAIGEEIRAGLPSGKLTQTPGIRLTSAAVPQSASDFTRRTQGCKEALGEPHAAATVTPPKFVDDTIRNLGNPTLCTTGSIATSGACANSITSRPANHGVKAHTAFPDTPNRPSQGGGQLAIFGNLEPGKEAAAFGGVTIAHVKSNIPVVAIRTRSGINPNYKVGEALPNLKYVESHHGNDLKVNPRRVPTPYKNVAIQPDQKKINKPANTFTVK
jgi:hypothetical protein